MLFKFTTMEIPHDIWLYLGQFIPDGDLRRLITLNSAFLELGLNSRYRDIRLHFLEKRTIRYLVRLMHVTTLSTFTQSPFLNFRDPAVAKRIRFFSLEPPISKTFDQNTPASDSHDRQRRPSLWKNGVNFLRKHVGISKKPGDQDESRYPPALRGFELALIDTVSGWSNVQEFSVKWWDSTELRQLRSFLLPAESTFGPNL